MNGMAWCYDGGMRNAGTGGSYAKGRERAMNDPGERV